MRKQRTPFKDYERPTDDAYQTNYIRITHIQIMCLSELSKSAFVLYMLMKDYAKSEPEFTFPHRIFKKCFSKQGFINARDELIEHGFLENFTSKQNLRIENTYRFSGKWRENYKDLIKSIVSGIV